MVLFYWQFDTKLTSFSFFRNKGGYFTKGSVFTKDRDERAKKREKNQQKILNERNIKMFLIKVNVLFG